MKKTLLPYIQSTIPPVLLAFSFIFTLYLHNIGEVTLGVLVAPMVVTGIFFMLASLVGYIFFKNKEKTSIFVSVMTVLFFSYRDLASFIGGRVIPFEFMNVGKNGILTVVYVSVIGILIRFLKRRSSKQLKQIYQYVFWFALFSVVIPLFGIVRYETTRRAKRDVHTHYAIPDVKNPVSDMPDIYYIVPDSYSSAATMKTYFGYDDSSLTDFLEEKGFYVVTRAKSNYPKTYLSLSSTLNMEYMDYLSVYENSSDETPANLLIKENSVVKFLKKQGYAYYQLGSWWWPTQYNRLATKNFSLDLQNPLGINTFDTYIIEATALKPLLPPSLFSSVVTESVEDKRKRIIYQFETLKSIVPLPGPKFIFVHILAPHGPNVFGKECEFITQKDLVGVNDEQGYTNQVSCINAKLRDTIDVILQNSVKPPIILLQSDEGAPFLAHYVKPDDNWKTADDELLRIKFPILSAYYFPDGDYAQLGETTTPVNSFRVILNNIFDLDIPLLEDRNFIMMDMEHRYEFRETTDGLKNY